VLVLLMKDIYELCLRMASCDTIHISGSMGIGIGVQATLLF
jgi:hypothetical protein